MIAVALAFARTKLGMAAIGAVLLILAFGVWIHQHNKRLIEEHDRAAAQQVQERVNESNRRGNAVPADPDSVQQNDRRCRDCR